MKKHILFFTLISFYLISCSTSPKSDNDPEKEVSGVMTSDSRYFVEGQALLRQGGSFFFIDKKGNKTFSDDDVQLGAFG